MWRDRGFNCAVGRATRNERDWPAYVRTLPEASGRLDGKAEGEETSSRDWDFDGESGRLRGEPYVKSMTDSDCALANAFGVVGAERESVSTLAEPLAPILLALESVPVRRIMRFATLAVAIGLLPGGVRSSLSGSKENKDDKSLAAFFDECEVYEFATAFTGIVSALARGEAAFGLGDPIVGVGVRRRRDRLGSGVAAGSGCVRLLDTTRSIGLGTENGEKDGKHFVE